MSQAGIDSPEGQALSLRPERMATSVTERFFWRVRALVQAVPRMWVRSERVIERLYQGKEDSVFGG
jgi:hypothetical protein